MYASTCRRSSLFFVGLLFLGCGGGDGGTPASPNPEPPDGEPTEPPLSDLDCERQQYPCSPSEASLEVIERSDVVGDSALAILAAGGTVAEAAAWLAARPDMDEVISDELAIRFRLDGGTGVWVLGEGALSPLGEPPGSPPDSPAPSAGTRTPDPQLDVVASGKDQKRALVLAPAHYSFQEWDDAPAVAGLLMGTRGYEGGVVYRKNETDISTEVNIGSYKGWRGYQVVHLSGHGRRVCTSAGCEAMLIVNKLETLLPPGPGTVAEKVKTITETGVQIIKSISDPEVDLLALNADFFAAEYPSGLDDTVVFLNACQTFGPQATDLVNAIQGNSTVVLGWTEAVYSSEAKAAALRFYEEAATNGFPAEVAHEKLGELGTGSPTKHGPSPTLRIGTRSEGGDLQIREVVTLLDPVTRSPLTAESRVPIDGNQGDGVEDAAPFLVRVDGVEEEDAPDMIVHVSINGNDADPVAVSSGEEGDNGQWFVSGTGPIGLDLEEDRVVGYQARVTLASGGESQHSAQATLTGTEPLMGWAWEFVATHKTFYTGGIPHTPYRADTRMIFRFVEGQAATEPMPRYEVVEGTVSYNYSHTYYDCTFSAPTLTFDVTEDVAQFTYLMFDTTTEPVSYGGYIFTYGPEFTVTETCEDTDTRTHRAVNKWMDLQGGETGQVSADRRMITGTYRSEVDIGVGTFVQESKYTITRIE